MKSKHSFNPISLFCLSTSLAVAFVQPQFGVKLRRSKSLRVLKDVDQEILIEPPSRNEPSTAIRAPLKYLGLYMGLGLTFPDLATSAQRAKDVSGVALDFVLDTAANTNTINRQVAEELKLDVVGEALPGVGTSGVITGGHTYNLGDTQLEGVDLTDGDGDGPFIFMQNLTAAALPVANPASAGLLSFAFLYCFEGGVEFKWGSPNSMTDGMISEHPSITFFAEKDAASNQALEGLTKVNIDPIPVTNLPSITLKINGVEIPALLDTGSPVTVMNSQAAKEAGIKTVDLPAPSKGTMNPFLAISNRFKDANALAKAASEGNVLTIAGPNGPVNLLKSLEATTISAKGADNDDVSFGESHIYVGDIPGLAALNGIGVDAPPAIVLGLDVLRRTPKMMLRAPDNEVYF